MSASALAMLADPISSPAQAGAASGEAPSPIGRTVLSTVPVAPDVTVRSATYTPSGKVLISSAQASDKDERQLSLATMDDDGRHFRTFFTGAIPNRAKDNGIRFMVFPDNKRIFLGDYIIECATSLETCKDPALVPVDYPPEIENGKSIAFRWSEIIVAPDNRHISWDTLMSNFSVMVFTGRLEKVGGAYRIADTQIVSTLDPFRKDPAHPDGVLPQRYLGGEVKQFVHGGLGISMVGAGRRDMPDSVVQSLETGREELITDVPGYTETTIFSPDEKLGMTMTSRFSAHTDPAILGLIPRPYPDSLNMGLSMLAYTYAVTGVRSGRAGNIGPALIDIASSKAAGDYLGTDLNAEEDWVYHSPMSWAPGGKKAMWVEARRTGRSARIRIVSLPDYRPAKPVPARITPDHIPGASSDLSLIEQFASKSGVIDVKVYGKHSGYVTYRRTPDGVTAKAYFAFSDDGKSTYSGSERMAADPQSRSTYIADVRVTGQHHGTMDLKMTFGPLFGPKPAEILFAPDDAGVPLSHGYTEFDGRRIDVETMVP
jgi:hypothetical protein